MRLIILTALLCLSMSVSADNWNYDGPIRIISPGENNGIEISETEHKQNLDQHKIVHDQNKVQRKRTTRFPTWFSSK